MSGDSAAALSAAQQVWSKRGVLVSPPTGQPWAPSHAALPVLWPVDGCRGELYYSPRDSRGRAHIACACLEAAPDGGLAVTGYDPEPILTPGPLGAFDDSGVTMSCLASSADATLLYYTGWTLGVTVPFYFYAGLAIRPHGQRDFTRVSPAPILERDAGDPYLTASPWVLYDNDTWRMWYVSCTRWERVAGEIRHYYHLRYAESTDGIHWRRAGRVAVDFADEHEYAISRPCVVRDPDRYRMWFAARGDRYRLGYAESADGIQWQRDDNHAGLHPSDTGWDAEMIAYPAIADMGGRRYMLYNGNGYGQTGIGYAISEAAG